MKYTINILLVISMILCGIILGKLFMNCGLFARCDISKTIHKCEYEGHTYLYYGNHQFHGLCHDENCTCKTKNHNAKKMFNSPDDPKTTLDERQSELLMKYFRKYKQHMAMSRTPIDGMFSRDDRFLGLLDKLEKQLSNGILTIMQDEYEDVDKYMMGVDLGLGYELGVLTDIEKKEVRALHTEIYNLIHKIK